MIYLTGDTHGRFGRIEEFCKEYSTTKEDILIILGDAGINFAGYMYDRSNKEFLKQLPITLFCIHGNHEMRPFTLPYYREETWHGGTIYVEDDFDNILFAKDGEIYDLDGKQAVVIGGAYSVDKYIRILRGWGWWENEQPTPEIKEFVETKLAENNWKVDIVLSHTTPYKYMPVEMFMSGIDQKSVDNSTEEWLGSIEERLQYDKWYCGHYHCEKKVDKVQIMFEDYTSL